MAASSIARPRTRAYWLVFLAVPCAAALVLLAGVAGVIPTEMALAVGVGGTAVWATAHLWRTALAIHHRDGTFTACRGAGFVGIAALAAGATAALPFLHPPSFRILGVVGVVVTATFYVLGTTLLPGAATSMPVRLRRIFDGVGLGVSLSFAAYLTTPLGHISKLILITTMCAAAGASIVTVIVLRARLHRPAALRCGFGAVLVMISVCTAVNVVLAGKPDIVLALLGLAIVAGLTLNAEGGTRREAPPRPAVPEPEQYLSSYPLLAVPAAVGVVAAVYHLARHGTWGTLAIVLGISMMSVLVLRELLVVRDIRQYASQLKEKEAHFRSLVAGATDLTLVLDERMRIRWQSPAAARVFGLADSEVVGRTFSELIHPDDVAGAQAVIESVLAGEHAGGPPALVNARFRDGNDRWRDTESTVTDQRGVPEVAALVVHVRDVGERRDLERTLHRLSYADQLTGLANRRALMRDLLTYRRRAGQQGTVLVIDLHGLAAINEAHGRETGDAVLIEVGRRIRSLLRGGSGEVRREIHIAHAGALGLVFLIDQCVSIEHRVSL